MWGRIFNSISDSFDFNQATLSGCIDIICVPQDDDGTLKSTPFHVRFGKAKLLRAREKIVKLTINGKNVDLRMKLGAEGEAYFVQEDPVHLDCNHFEDSPFASPINSPRSVVEAYEISDDTITEENLSKGPLMDNIRRINKFKASESVSYSMNIEDKLEVELRDSNSPLDEFKLGDSPKLSSDSKLQAQIPTKDSIELSLCGHILKKLDSDQTQANDIFNANIITEEKIKNSPLLWFDPNLIIRFKKAPPYYPWKIAYPLLFSWYAYDQPPSIQDITKLNSTSVNLQKSKRWYSWLLNSKLSNIESIITSADYKRELVHPETMKNTINNMDSSPSVTHLETNNPSLKTSEKNTKIWWKSLRPSSSQLRAMQLQLGPNTITFSVTSALQGTKILTSTIYLWPKDSKIIVSDVDGTITRSDLLGHLMPIVGRDWTHDGVAHFYTKLRQNGYHILYLTSRAIGLADSTRNYLFSITQNEKSKLPDGPLILSPDRFFYSLKREVVDRTPYVFKIAALRDIRKLFQADHFPFHAGFGNRETDHKAYVHIGIPASRVFIIDRKGAIRQLNTSSHKTYESLSRLTENIFRPVKNLQIHYTGTDQDELIRKKKVFSHTLHLDGKSEINSFSFCGQGCFPASASEYSQN